MTESELKRTKYHLQKAIEVISRIEIEHLDREVQMRRLQDVAARFSPLMNRLKLSLPVIQNELGLPSQIPDCDNLIGSDLTPTFAIEDNNSNNEEKRTENDKVVLIVDECKNNQHNSAKESAVCIIS
jgi:hypothetical protein